MQEYELSRQTHEMTIVLRLKLYKILLYTARIPYENTHDMRAIYHSTTHNMCRKIANKGMPFLKFFFKVATYIKYEKFLLSH